MTHLRRILFFDNVAGLWTATLFKKEATTQEFSLEPHS